MTTPHGTIQSLLALYETGDITHPTVLKALCDLLDVGYQKHLVDQTPYADLPWQDPYIQVGGPELLPDPARQTCRTILTEPNPLYKLVHIQRAVSDSIWHPQTIHHWGLIPRLLTCVGGNWHASDTVEYEEKHPDIIREFMLQTSRTCRIKSVHSIQALCRQYVIVVPTLCDMSIPVEMIHRYLDHISLAYYITGLFHCQYKVPHYHRPVVNRLYIDLVTQLTEPFLP